MADNKMVARDLYPSIWDRWPRLGDYARLARWDRPIGIWLLYWPCVWGLGLAPSFRVQSTAQQWWWLVLLFVGGVAMRGAGCIVNDVTDRTLDAAVARTQNRPLASGRIMPWQALLFAALNALVGAAVLLQLSPLAIVLGLATLPLIIAYPWMKRITWWPQAFLGVIFNSGAVIAFAALEGRVTVPVIAVYLAGILWTLAYDSVYAHLDSDDDALIGIKSTARLWGARSKLVIGWLWVASGALFGGGLLGGGLSGWSLWPLVPALIINLVAQALWNPANARYTLGFFKLQAQIGLLLALAATRDVWF